MTRKTPLPILVMAFPFSPESTDSINRQIIWGESFSPCAETLLITVILDFSLPIVLRITDFSPFLFAVIF
jgi:hypothetical protein